MSVLPQDRLFHEMLAQGRIKTTVYPVDKSGGRWISYEIVDKQSMEELNENKL